MLKLLYLGPSYSNQYISEIINEKVVQKYEVKFFKYDELYPYIVDKLVKENSWLVWEN